MLEASGGQNLDLRRRARDEPRFGEGVGIDHGVPLETTELAEVDDDVLATPVIVESAQLREPLLERHLTTLETSRKPDARPGSLTLLATTARLALSGALAATDPLARLTAAFGGAQLVQLHAALSDSAPRWRSRSAPSGESAGLPSTLTRWRTLWTIPRIEAVASCSTVWCSLRRPSAASVAF